MKRLLIIFLLFSLTAHSQNIGDKFTYLMDNCDEFNITKYYIGNHYVELVSITDTLTTLYMVGFKPQKVFSIHYVYEDIESLSYALKIIIKDAVMVGNGVWIKNNILITVRNTDIIIQDVRRTKRISKYKKQGGA